MDQKKGSAPWRADPEFEQAIVAWTSPRPLCREAAAAAAGLDGVRVIEGKPAAIQT